MIASWVVSKRLKNKFKKYSKIHLRNGMSGAEIAEKMLADHGIKDVKVVSTAGMLTDHYDPRNKTVNLSASVYSQRNAASAAVAAHEVGHAVQHAQAYEWLTIRSKLVPMVSVSSKFSQWLVFGGLILGAASDNTGIGFYIAIVGLGFMALATTFSFITLPVEYDASNRALAWLKNKNMDLKYFQEPNIKLKFSFSEEQYNLVQDGLDLCGDTMIGKSRIFRWVPPNSVWRIASSV